MRDVTIVVGTIGQSIMRSEYNGQTWARIEGGWVLVCDNIRTYINLRCLR